MFRNETDLYSVQMFLNMRFAYERIRIKEMIEQIKTGLLALLRPFAALLKSRKFWLYAGVMVSSWVMYSSGAIMADKMAEIALYATGILTGAIAFEDGMKFLGGLFLGLTKGFNPGNESDIEPA